MIRNRAGQQPEAAEIFSQRPERTVMSDADTTSEIAKLLAEALIGEVVPPPFGALVIGVIFPSGGLPSYFSQVYAEMKKIVKQEVTADRIATIDGKVNGTQQFIRDSYTPLKNDPKKTAQEKFNAITPFVDDLYQNVVATLRDDRYAQPGFPVFLIGASVHLALIQEQAFTDPDHQADPSKSSYAQAVKNDARDSADFAAGVWPKIVAARRAAIVLKSPASWGDAVEEAPFPPVNRTCWRWEDELTGEHGPNHVGFTASAPEQRAAAEAEIPPRQDAVVGALISDLGNPDTIIANWRKLITTPLPGRS